MFPHCPDTMDQGHTHVDEYNLPEENILLKDGDGPQDVPDLWVPPNVPQGGLNYHNPHIEILSPLILLLTILVRVQCIALPADINFLVRKGSMELITHLMREMRKHRIPGIHYLTLTPMKAIGNMIYPAYLLQ